MKEFYSQMKGSDEDFTNEELDEIFKDDPVFQEAQRRLAAMSVRDLLCSIPGSTDISDRANPPCPIVGADTTDEQREIFNRARKAVHASLHPEKAKQEDPPQATRARPVVSAHVKADATSKSEKINQQNQQQSIEHHFTSRYRGPQLSKKPTKEDVMALIMRTHSLGHEPRRTTSE